MVKREGSGLPLTALKARLRSGLTPTPTPVPASSRRSSVGPHTLPTCHLGHPRRSGGPSVQAVACSADDKRAPALAKRRLLLINPMLAGAAARGPNRSSWLTQTAVRIIKAHESEMAACNKSFTSSCFVHFLNNNRTFPPSPLLPLVSLCSGSIISQMHSSKPPG